MKKLLLTLLLAATIRVSAQSPFDGRWEGDVPAPDGVSVRCVLEFSVDEEMVLGRLTFGGTERVPIEGGRLRGDVLSFHRTLEDGSRVQFLARIVDGTLRVGMMPIPAGETASSVENPQIVNFTARRPDGWPFGPFRRPG